MSIESVRSYLSEEKDEILSWARNKGEQLLQQSIDDQDQFREAMWRAWVDYYDSLMTLSDELTPTNVSSAHISDALREENEVIGELIAILKRHASGSTKTGRDHLESLMTSLEIERRTNEEIRAEL